MSCITIHSYSQKTTNPTKMGHPVHENDRIQLFNCAELPHSNNVSTFVKVGCQIWVWFCVYSFCDNR